MAGDLNDELEERRYLVRQVRQRLEALQRAGVSDFPRSSFRGAAVVAPPEAPARPIPAPVVEALPPAEPVVPAPEPVISPTSPRPAPAPPRPAPVIPPPSIGSLFEEPGFDTPAVPAEERPAVLAGAAAEVSTCVRCPHLARTRTQTVFGTGTPTTRLMFIGEAPGADEDRMGEPFVGRAGQLLTDMITKGMGLTRDQVYIANILKCRPPENRTPTLEEADNCFPYLEQQIAIIRPEFLCLLGKVAVQARPEHDPDHGQDSAASGTVIAESPPSSLTTRRICCRTPSAKKDAWEDLQMLMKEMGIVRPGSVGSSQ